MLAVVIMWVIDVHTTLYSIPTYTLSYIISETLPSTTVTSLKPGGIILSACASILDSKTAN